MLWHNTLKGTIMPSEYLLPHIVSAEHRAHLERAGHHFWVQPLQKRKGAGFELVLHFTASERDCNGCLRASRAKLACSLRSGSPSLTYGLPRVGEGGGLMSLGARESHRLQIWESAKNQKKNLEKSNHHRGEIQLRDRTSTSSPRDREEESTGPRYYLPLDTDSLSTSDSMRPGFSLC